MSYPPLKAADIKRPIWVESEGEVAPLPLCAVGEFFLNKVWNALLCFIICSLILLLRTFTNRAQRKRKGERVGDIGEVHGSPGNMSGQGRSVEQKGKENVL